MYMMVIWFVYDYYMSFIWFCVMMFIWVFIGFLFIWFLIFYFCTVLLGSSILATAAKKRGPGEDSEESFFKNKNHGWIVHEDVLCLHLERPPGSRSGGIRRSWRRLHGNQGEWLNCADQDEAPECTVPEYEYWLYYLSLYIYIYISIYR